MICCLDQVHGILVQLPLPDHIEEATVLKSIRVDKDADGFAAENASRHVDMLLNQSELSPPLETSTVRIVYQLKDFPRLFFFFQHHES